MGKLCNHKDEGGRGLQTSRISVWQCLESNFGVWLRNRMPFLKYSKDDTSEIHHTLNRLDHIHCHMAGAVLSLLDLWLAKKLIKRVGSGLSISVWNDLWFLTTRPRPANINQHNIYPDLIVDSLINANSRTWNLQANRSLVDTQDVKIIESIPLNQTQVVYRDGWNFTNNGKYTWNLNIKWNEFIPTKREKRCQCMDPRSFS